MVRKFALAVLVAMALTISLSPAAAADAPTPAFLAAALRAQGSASVELKYGSPREPGIEDVTEYLERCYIRTPEAIALTQTYSIPPDEVKETTRYSYDISTAECRTLTTRSGIRPQGSVLVGLSGAFLMQDIPDPIRFPLLPFESDRPCLLPDWVERGTVSPTKDEVEGYQCWRVEASTIDRKVKHTIWLDPAIGFCPRRIDTTDGAGNTTPYRFEDYKQAREGIWLPAKLVLKQKGGDGKADIVSVLAISISCKTYTKDELLVKFPDNTLLLVNGVKTSLPE